MVRSEYIKELFRSHKDGDDKRFLKTAEEIVAEERQQGHTRLAEEFEKALQIPEKVRENPVDEAKKAAEQLVKVFHPGKYLDDIILSPERLAQVENVMHQFQNWDVLVSNGVFPVSKLLFCGHPGCGKTLCAKVIASEIGIPLLRVRSDMVFSSSAREAAENLGKVFDLARRDSYVVLFRNSDAIGGSRNLPAENGEYVRRTETLLQLVDSFRGRSILIATACFPESLDPAVLRRFDDAIPFALPTKEKKEKLFSMRLTQYEGPIQAFEALLGATEGFSYADIEGVCRRIKRSCILNGTRNYGRRDIEQAVEQQRQLVSLGQK